MYSHTKLLNLIDNLNIIITRRVSTLFMKKQ